MPYSVLEKEVQSLPLSLQKDIETYVLSVIDKYKKNSRSPKKASVSSILDKLTGILSDSPKITAKEIRAERLFGKYGV